MIDPQTTTPDPTPQPSPEVPAAPEVTPVETPKEAEGSLAEHAASVSGDRDDAGRFKGGRHRARSQRASAEDVPRIAELTKNWRTTEERAIKAEQELAEIRKQIAPKPAAPQLKPVPKVETSEFTEKEPTLEDFRDADDPYLAHARALAAFDRKKERFEEQQTRAKSEAESAQTHNQAQLGRFFQEKAQDFGGRLNALMQREPEAVKLFEAVQQVPLTDAMHAAIMLDPRGEEIMLHIAKNVGALEGELDDLFLLTDGKPVTQGFVALVQRRLNRWMQTAQPTGSVAPVPVKVNTPAPRPPTPVRTAPMKQADQPPKDEDSLSAHSAFYGPKHR